MDAIHTYDRTIPSTPSDRVRARLRRENSAANCFGYDTPVGRSTRKEGWENAACARNIPAVSDWGMVAMTLLLWTAETIVAFRPPHGYWRHQPSKDA